MRRHINLPPFTKRAINSIASHLRKQNHCNFESALWSAASVCKNGKSLHIPEGPINSEQ